MNWTNEKPKVEGWYWVRGAYANDLIFEVYRSGDKPALHISDEVNHWNLDEPQEKPLQFCGPIQHPDGWSYPYPSNNH